MKKPDYRLGQLMTVTAKLVRRHGTDPIKGRFRVTWETMPLAAPITGIYAGIRYKQNGRVDRDEYYQRTWVYDETVPCVVIYFSSRQKPIFAPLSAIVDRVPWQAASPVTPDVCLKTGGKLYMPKFGEDDV